MCKCLARPVCADVWQGVGRGLGLRVQQSAWFVCATHGNCPPLRQPSQPGLAPYPAATAADGLTGGGGVRLGFMMVRCSKIHKGGGLHCSSTPPPKTAPQSEAQNIFRECAHSDAGMGCVCMGKFFDIKCAAWCRSFVAYFFVSLVHLSSLPFVSYNLDVLHFL